MFTPGLLCILIVSTEILIYAVFLECLNTIKHCSTFKTYRKGLEKGLITPNEFKSIINILKEEKKDGNE